MSRPAPAAGVRAARPRRVLLLPVLLLVAATVAVYAPALDNGFISMDDERFVAGNPHVREGLGRRTALWALTSLENANWYPATRLSHLADASLFGMQARWHHFTSVALHAAGAAVLCAALHALTGGPWRSFVAAALFALHPLQVESVAWASERSMVLAGLFVALTLLLWARHLRRPHPARYAAALLAFALALASKPIAVTVPVLLLLLDAWPLARLGPAAGGAAARLRGAGGLVLEKAPFFAFAAAGAALAFAAQRHGGAVQSLEALPLGERLGNAALALGAYLAKLFAPAGLAVYYPRAPLPPVAVALSVALTLALSALAVRLRHRSPWLGVGWLWFVTALLPTIGLVQVGAQAMADRYAYLPLVGAAVALVWLVARATPSARRPLLLVPLAAAALCALGLASARQARLWRDDLTLYAHTLAVTADNWMIEPALGNALAREGRYAEALPHLQDAVRLSPGDPDLRYDLGNVLFHLGRLGEAEAAFRRAIGMRPGDADFHHNLGATLSARGRPAEAEAALREALRLRPGNAVTHFLLGNVLALKGLGAEAAAAYREALRLQPDFAAAREELVRLATD